MAVVTALAMVLTGCGGDEDEKQTKRQRVEQPAGGPSEASVTIAPKDGAKDVATTGALEVTAAKGRLTEVVVKDGDGGTVKGSISEDGSSWKPSAHLRTETLYRVKAVAEDGEGREAAENASFTTVVPAASVIGYFTPENGDEVGVGMPVSLRFDKPVANREAVEAAVRVTADPQVEVEGHWFGDQRLDFRPEEYWAAGTEVTLDLRLDGVEASDGVYGSQYKKVSFTVGRSQVSVVDAKKKTMTVTRNGEKLRTIPITTGAPATPTWNGKMVISEQFEVTRMDGATVGFTDDDGEGEYDIKDVPHAQRLSTSGTFIHGNYWAAPSQFGSVNVSHGCIGLQDVQSRDDSGTPGAWFFDNSMIGDVVEVRNAKDEVIAPDNGLNGWNMDWEEWTAPQE